MWLTSPVWRPVIVLSLFHRTGTVDMATGVTRQRCHMKVNVLIEPSTAPFLVHKPLISRFQIAWLYNVLLFLVHHVRSEMPDTYNSLFMQGMVVLLNHIVVSHNDHQRKNAGFRIQCFECSCSNYAQYCHQHCMSVDSHAYMCTL